MTRSISGSAVDVVGSLSDGAMTDRPYRSSQVRLVTLAGDVEFLDAKKPYAPLTVIHTKSITAQNKKEYPGGVLIEYAVDGGGSVCRIRFPGSEISPRSVHYRALGLNDTAADLVMANVARSRLGIKPEELAKLIFDNAPDK